MDQRVGTQGVWTVPITYVKIIISPLRPGDVFFTQQTSPLCHLQGSKGQCVRSQRRPSTGLYFRPGSLAEAPCTGRWRDG